MRRVVLPSVIALLTFAGGVSAVMFGLSRRPPVPPGGATRPPATPEPARRGEAPAAAAAQDPAAPRRAGCPGMKGRPLTSTNSGVANVLFSVNLGRLSDERPYDEITLREARITPDIYTPDLLNFPTVPKSNRIEVIPDPDRPPRMIGDGTSFHPYRVAPLRQARVPEALVDVDVLGRWEYELRLYRPADVGPKSGGFYTVMGRPYAVYQFRNPNPPAADSFEITKTENGREDRSVYFYEEGSDTWTLTTNGREVVRKTSAVNPSDPCRRVETRFDAEGGQVRKTVKIFKAFPWGQQVVRKVEDPDGEARTTTYTYFEDPAGPHYTFLKTTTHPDGRVQRHNLQPDPTMPSGGRP